MHISQSANNLTCQHCWKRDGNSQQPVNGDFVPYHRHKDPGGFDLPLTCPHCGKQWYVVWDQDPGPVRKLGLYT